MPSCERAGSLGFEAVPCAFGSQLPVVASRERLEAHVLDQPMSRERLPDRSKVIYHAIADLEQFQKPTEPTGSLGSDERIVRGWTRSVLFHGEARRVLRLVRSEVYSFASKMKSEIRSRRRLLDEFGEDALTVFAAGGPLLNELHNAANSLGRDGMSAAAAMQARTALLTLGRELYRGSPGTHTVARQWQGHANSAWEGR